MIIPGEEIFNLPEKVLQFGTGVLLRGLPDYFIDKANRQGIFNGRIVVVKSTSNGGTDSFSHQDGLYTLCVRGLEGGKKVDEAIINASISRVLSAKEDWQKIIACAHNPEMQIIISNTTEIGITLTHDNIGEEPPKSFPGKLLAFLLERFKAFKGSKESGMVIIPTELITDNAKKLRAIVLELARLNSLDESFITWLQSANQFCNSLVDRIVPGKLTDADLFSAQSRWGYTDDLMIMAECFRLWAIESDDPRVKEILSFAKADEGVVIAPDIEKFRELKLRLLNGTHTFSCGLAWLAGYATVKEAMENEDIAGYIEKLDTNEIAPLLVNEDITYEEACTFAARVQERFRNPFLDHQWISISVQYSSKMKMRNIPLLVKHFKKFGNVPELMSLGFAAYLLFMKCHKDHKEQFEGTSNGARYIIQDDHAEYMSNKWHDNDIERLVDSVLSDTDFWGDDLSSFEGFAQKIKNDLRALTHHGVITTLQRLQLNKTTV